MPSQSITYPPGNFLGTFQNTSYPRKASHTLLGTSCELAYTSRRCVHVSRVHVCNVDMHICMYQQMPSSQRIRQPFFVRLSGARNVGCNDQQEGGNGIDTSREHSRKLPRCHSGRTCRSECVVSRGPGQHVTWLAGKAGTAARDFPNHAFSSCHQ